MFKIFKPPKSKREFNDKNSSMPQRTFHLNLNSIEKEKPKSSRKYGATASLNNRTNHFAGRFLNSSTSRSTKRGYSFDNMYAALKRNLIKDENNFSQKSFRKIDSLNRRDFLSGNSLQKSKDQFKSRFSSQNYSIFSKQKKLKEFNKILFQQKDLNTSHKPKSHNQAKRLQKTFNEQKMAMKYPHNVIGLNKLANNSFELSNTSECCTIIILIEKNGHFKQFTVRYKVKKISSLIQFLKNYAKQASKNEFIQDSIHNQYQEISTFQTVQGHLQIDYYLTLLNEDGSFLNGQKLTLRPLYSVKQSHITLNSFQIIQCIGNGGFSSVYLCRFKENGKFYAMKVISKQFIIKNQKKKIIMNQRNIMVELRNKSNLAQLYFAFQSKEHLIFVMEYYQGGQLFNLVKRFRKMSQSIAKFYITEILIGLEQIHSHSVVYRDFKPENIMIDLEGHACIADFGLAKPKIQSCDDRAYSFCGSPEYMPPEMILKDGHSLPVDFYCIGALLYQLVTGLPPFYSTDPDRIYDATLNQEIAFPNHVNLSNQLEDLLLSLLCKDQKYRLGSTFGVKQVLSHPWFRNVRQQDFKNRKITPPVNFKKIQDLRFNADQMQQQNSSKVKQILKSQDEQLESKYLKIMNGFYYDYRLQDQTISDDENSNLVNKKMKKQNGIISIEKNKNNSSSLALTNCTKRSQNSVNFGCHKKDQKLTNLFKKKDTFTLSSPIKHSKTPRLSNQMKSTQRKSNNYHVQMNV